MIVRDEIFELAQEVFPTALAARRHLHAHPELSFEEFQTSAYVVETLRSFGLEPQTGLAGTGIKVVITGESSGPCIALRADMDALPLEEKTGLPFASKRPGIMHACGHDVHTAVLLATAEALAMRSELLRGTVVLLFQPGEEKHPGGASLMIGDGCLSNPSVDAVFGLHVSPYDDVGGIYVGAGPQFAASDNFRVKIIGSGGHASRPHLAVDPVVTAAQAVVNLQTIVARSVNPFDQAVLTIGSIQGGHASNIIPDEVVFEGTVRTLDPAARELIPSRMEQVIAGTCAAAGANFDWEYQRGYPVLINDQAMTELAHNAATWVLGEENVHSLVPVMGGEDFAYYLQQVPGSFAKLGCGVVGSERFGLHSPKMMVDEDCMKVGIKYFLAVVSRFLTTP